MLSAKKWMVEVGQIQEMLFLRWSLFAEVLRAGKFWKYLFVSLSHGDLRNAWGRVVMQKNETACCVYLIDFDAVGVCCDGSAWFQKVLENHPSCRPPQCYIAFF